MASADTVSLETVQMAEESYRRCDQEAFLRAFYKHLLEKDDGIRQKFAKTDFDKQVKLLQHGLGVLLIYAKRRNPALLDRIAMRHGKSDLDVAPPLYAFFTDALVETVREFDPQCSAEIETAWRQAVAPGIDFMCGQYQRRSQ